MILHKDKENIFRLAYLILFRTHFFFDIEYFACSRLENVLR